MAFQLSAASLLFLASSSAFAQATLPAGNQAQPVTLEKKLQIPGEVLKPGTYVFSIEDTMKDRAVVRIASKDNDEHYLILGVPNDKLPSATEQDGLIFFDNAKEDERVLRGWHCPGCTTSLEFAYPKLEAVKITKESGEPAMAVNPEADKLPLKLSGDDMKVVKLWLLSPQRIMPNHHGEGLNAAQYEGGSETAANTQSAMAQPREAQRAEAGQNANPEANANPAPGANVNPAPGANVNPAPAPGTSAARTETPSGASVETAAARPAERNQQRNGRLPETASNTYSLGALGLVALLAGLGLRLRRLRTARS